MAVPSNNNPLMRLVELASGLGAAQLADEAFELADRVTDGRFFCACVGQFKRGKSTFINALVGEEVLPVGVVPVTSAITVIQYGKRRGARVRFSDGNSIPIALGELKDYVAEELNPGNEKGVVLVELQWPSPLLEDGLCLVDTPGVGSVHGWNTETTRAFVPHIDAAIVVIGAEPPISGEELKLVEQVAQQTKELLFALNKADRLASHETEEAAAFTRKVLADRLAGKECPLYVVSATERLYRAEPTRDWAALEERLFEVAERSGRKLVAAAQRRGTARIVALLKTEIEARMEALRRPFGESETRLRNLQAELEQAEHSLAQLLVSSGEDRERLEGDLEIAKERFLKRVIPQAKESLEASVNELGLKGAALRDAGLEKAREIGVAHLEAWAAEARERVDRSYSDSAERLVRHAANFLKKLSPSALPALKDIPRRLGDAEGGWAVDIVWLDPSAAAATPDRPAFPGVDLFRSGAVNRAAVEALKSALARSLAESSTAMADATRARAKTAQEALEATLHKRLEEVASVARRAMARAKSRQQAGSEAVRADLERLQGLASEIARIERAL